MTMRVTLVVALSSRSMELLTPEEVRVAGCLVEKQMTTPDSYPLTHNALVAACNQLSNRNPVVSYDDSIVMHALAGLRAKQLARMLHVPGSRGPKHRHVLDETLELDRGEVALLAVLALRGPQTVGELRTRTERMHPFASLSDVEETLERLGARPEPLVIRLERQPGQKEARYTHLLSGLAAAEEAAAANPYDPAEPAAPRAPRPAPVDDERLAALEARLAAVEAGLAALRADLGAGSAAE
jgi:uncharacterized protein